MTKKSVTTVAVPVLVNVNPGHYMIGLLSSVARHFGREPSLKEVAKSIANLLSVDDLSNADAVDLLEQLSDVFSAVKAQDLYSVSLALAHCSPFDMIETGWQDSEHLGTDLVPTAKTKVARETRAAQAAKLAAFLGSVRVRRLLQAAEKCRAEFFKD